MSDAQVFEDNIARIIGQVRFRPTIPVLNGARQIAAELEEQFEEWRAEKPDDITLYSPTDKRFLQIASDATTYVNEHEQGTEELHSLITQVMANNTGQFSVTEIRRVGFRITKLMKTAFSFSDLVDLIYKKFYTSSEESKKISTEVPRDVVFVLDGEKNNFLNHVQIGPVKKEEAFKFFRPHFDLDKDLIQESNLLVDIDVFSRDGLAADGVSQALQSAIDENSRILDEYIEYLVGTV